MNRFLICMLVLLAWTCAFGFAAAQQEPDVYIEELVTRSQPGQTDASGVIKSWVSGKKLRREAPGGAQVSIFRADLGKVYLLNSVTKQYFELPISVIRKDQENNLDFYAPVKDGKVELPEALYRKTGKVKKIGKWNTQEVEVLVGQSGPDISVKSWLWISKETGYDQNFVRRLFSITMGGDVSPQLKEVFDKMTALDGYPVQKVTTTTANKQTYTSTETLVKIERVDKMDGSLFEVPEGFEKLEGAAPGMVPSE